MLSLTEIAVWLGFELSENLFVESFPLDANVCILRFANVPLGIRIYYRYERHEMVSGGIIMWHGLLANIPPDYVLCDGDNGTPDLREKFVRGSADTIDPGGVGGNVNHTHTFTGDGHLHGIPVGTGVAAGTDKALVTTAGLSTGTTDNEDGRPPFYDIAYIMKT